MEATRRPVSGENRKELWCRSLRPISRDDILSPGGTVDSFGSPCKMQVSPRNPDLLVLRYSQVGVIPRVKQKPSRLKGVLKGRVCWATC